MKPKCALALLLVTCMLTSSCLTACSNANGKHPTNSTGTAPAVSETETIDPRATLDTPELDFGGYIFRVLYIDDPLLFTTFDVDGYNSDPVNDAIYDRNRIIEDELHITFESQTTSIANAPSALSKQVQSGLTGPDAYDLIMQICRDAYSLTLQNLLCDYNRLEYVDTDKDYYFNEVNKQFSIGGRLFFAFGADSLNILALSNCMMFNKKIATEHNIPDLYSEVNNKEWTYDHLFSYCNEVAEDLNGDGSYTLGTDIMGLVGREDYSIPAAWISAGESLISKNEDDMPYYSALGDGRMTTIIQEAITFFSSGICSCYNGSTPYQTFAENKAFMMCGGITHLGNIRDMQDDYGVIPWPMYDRQQGQYYTRLTDGWLNCVPTDCPNTERTSAVLQALAYYSYHTVYDAYYKLALSAKYVRDPESVDMIKLILSNVTVDLGDTVWYADMRGSITQTLAGANGASKVSSTLKRQESIADTRIKKVAEFLSKNQA
ncbi:MAG: hypothetical protein ACI4WV_00825 [Eubacteriales bacterium]